MISCKTNGGRGGFTIVELMVVILIIGIISMVAAASIMESRKNTVLTDVVRQTSNILKVARSRALLRNVATRISIDKSDPYRAWMRLDESTSTSCNDFPNASDPVRWNILGLNLGDQKWTVAGARIYMSELTVGGGNASSVVICMNRRGRVLVQNGPQWTRLVGFIEIKYQRQEGGVDVGVERVVRLEQGGIARIVR